MKKLIFLFYFVSSFAFSQTEDFTRFPNSFIYDIDLANSMNYEGFIFPVRKAYEIWNNYKYLKTDGNPTPIPAGVQTASLYWEDVPGLVNEVIFFPSPNTDPRHARIKVKINNARGKGNAVVVFKVDGVIYWSWHIWVTDNPENGTSYQQGWELDGNFLGFKVKYMDRNLGAVSGNFIGNNWQKSGGLLYEWGRKDPFPGLVYKDGDFYQISGEVGTLRHKQIDPINTIPVQVRAFNEIEKNIQYSVKNPLTYIINTDATGNWFSNQRYRVPGVDPNFETWDLWSDNAKGRNSNANSSSGALKKESISYELKSELDPCPNGWRVPSYYGRVTQNNNLAFFGRKNWGNDDITNNSKLFPDVANPVLYGTKVYPGLGMDFTNAENGVRNIGLIPNSGGYVYYPNSAAPNAPIGVTFQDNAANGTLWSATYGYDGARGFSLISDAYRTNTSVGLHAIYVNSTFPTRSGNAVRCMKDPNVNLIGNFPTLYLSTTPVVNFKEGLDNPNSYIVNGQTELRIPVNKAFSVYNQILSDHGTRSSSHLVAKVLWTTNPNLVTSISINNNPLDAKNSEIVVGLNPNEKGNVVVSLHNEDTNSPAYWSWHIWAPNGSPDQNTITYTTEIPIATAYNFVNPTKSKIAPLTTTFMDRNLGAIEAFPNTTTNATAAYAAQGLHFQWGRKDPIPSFTRNATGNTPIFLGSENSSDTNTINYTTVNNANYEANYAVSYQNYQSTNTNNYLKLRQNILYSVENPIKYMYQSGIGAIYDGGDHTLNDLTKIRDWVSNERAQAPERWGHADKKSVFDPCPQGWRVPDVSYTYLYQGSKGSSPWYNSYNNDAYGKSGVIQDQWHNLTTYYQGIRYSTLGWIFNGATYKIGNFPADGMRGELGNYGLTYTRSGVWTASLADMHTGFGIAMEFEGSRMQTATGAYPQAAMGVRCSRDEPRLLASVTSMNANKTSENKAQPEKNKEQEELEVYPNPFTSTLYINNESAVSFEIFDLSGKLLQMGEVKNSRIETGQLPKGIYILKLKLNNQKEISTKIIKN